MSSTFENNAAVNTKILNNDTYDFELKFSRCENVAKKLEFKFAK